jgi:DNA-binding IclR family transcriptional regulator
MSSLATGLRLLRRLSPAQPFLRVSEAAEALSLPKSTVSRLLKVLAASDLLERDAGGRGYRCGPLALHLGNLYLAQHSLLDLVDAALVELVERFAVTGYAGVLNGTEIVLLRVRQGRAPLRIVYEVGGRVPAHVTAIGMALLARLDDARIAALYGPTLSYPPMNTQISIGRFVKELAQVRRRGWAASFGTTHLGIGAVGAAVASPNEPQSIGFSLSFPLIDADRTRRQEIATAVTAAARAIGTRIGDPFWHATARAPAPAGPPPGQGPAGAAGRMRRDEPAEAGL